MLAERGLRQQRRQEPLHRHEDPGRAPFRALRQAGQAGQALHRAPHDQEGHQADCLTGEGNYFQPLARSGAVLEGLKSSSFLVVDFLAWKIESYQ